MLSHLSPTPILRSIATARSTSCWGAIFIAGVLLSSAASAASADESSPSVNAVVFVKVLLPAKQTAPDRPRDIPVEKWIEGVKRTDGQKQLRAVTGWVQLPADDLSVADVWDATVDGKHWGCPVHGTTLVQPDGRIRVELIGWTPAGADVRGSVIPAEPGSRRLARVGYQRDPAGAETGPQFEVQAYVAIIVSPVTEAK